MVVQYKLENAGVRFGVYVEELREFFRSRQVPFGSPGNLVAFAAKVEKPGPFQDEMGSVGQKRQAALHGGRRDKLIVAPNLWAGVGLVRVGVGTALVGTPDQIAQRLREYQALGIDTIVGSGYPHLEEAYRFAELVFPLLPLAQQPGKSSGNANMGPFGETIANISRPTALKAGQS